MEETNSQRQTKVCPKCKNELPLTEFGRDRHTASGYSCYCRSCISKRSKSFRRRKAAKSASPTDSLPYGRTPREIIQEVRDRLAMLKSMGYSFEGKLTYLQEIKL